jgi:hypothetical protein
MKMVLMFLAALPAIASAQISEGVDTLPVGQGVNLNTAVISGIQYNISIFPCFYPCSTTITSGDVITLVNTVTGCECPCASSYAIGSTHPFFIAKQNFTDMNLSNQLNLNDTGLFSKVDSTLGGSCLPGGTCVLPSIQVGRGISFDSEKVWVLETSQQKYAMVRMTPLIVNVVSSCEAYSPPYTANGGTALHWYIQNNGSLDFSGVSQTSVLSHNANPILRVASQNQRYRVGLASSITNRQISEVYTIQGKGIDAGALKKMNAVVIYRESQ